MLLISSTGKKMYSKELRMDLHDSAAIPPFLFPNILFIPAIHLPPYLLAVLVGEDTLLLAFGEVA